jgi:cytochrome c oxidase subunit 1
VFSTDHKVGRHPVLVAGARGRARGIVLSLVMRIQLAFPAHEWKLLAKLLPNAAPGGALAPEFYLALVTMHGTMMVFFVLTTAPLGGFGNAILPLQIGARDMAFPRLNMLSVLDHRAGFVTWCWRSSSAGGAPIAGWTRYPPLSALSAAGPGRARA